MMMMMKHGAGKKSFDRWSFFFVLFVFFVTIPSVPFLEVATIHAASPSDINVTAELSRNRVAAGDMVQFDVQVTGTQQADLPREITVDGLQIRLAGQSSQVQMVNFAVTSSVLYSYIIIPLRSGTFTIPSIQVRAEGKYFRTSPRQLTVVGSASTTAPAASAQASVSSMGYSSVPAAPSPPAATSGDKLAFAELTIAKKKLYAGEIVPAEIRFYVDAHCNAVPRRGVDFSQEGLIIEKLSDPESSTEVRNGTPYNIATFRTLISAIKPGTLEVGPATLDVAIEIPGSGGIDPIAQMLGRPSSMQQRPLTLKSNKVSLEVLPLPKEGCPDSFSGAIGEFQIDALASPKKYVVGDPVTLALTIEGNGNINALSMPQLTDTDGWRTYPPTSRVDATDAFGLHGIKTFETTMITQQPLTATPGALFSYFNPNTEKYVTLTTKPFPLKVIPQAGSSTNAPVATAPAVAPVPAKNQQDQPLEHFSTRSWQTPFYRKEFMIASSALFVALLLLAFYLAWQRYQQTEALLQQQQLKKLWAELQDNALEPIAFYDKATSYAKALLKKDPSRRSELEEIFRRRDEINYGARELILPASEREKVLDRLSAKVN